jgi:FecR protein
MPYAPRVFLFSVLLLPAFLLQANAEDKYDGQPQMVWLTYTQGQVKFSPGQDGDAKLDKTWIAANPGQVLEAGYTLVTEDGRAEIEFEDGSVAYLADHSALQFNWLWSTSKGLYTELALLTGKATIAHDAPRSPALSINRFQVATPAFEMHMLHKQTTTIQSTVDAGVFEAVEGTQMIEQTSALGVLRQGESVAYIKGQPPALLPPHEKTADESDWDQWVAGRLATHRALIAEGLQESGMKEAIPGLAGMVENGHFYDCPPHGKCWQANAGHPLAYLEPQAVLSAQATPEALDAQAYAADQHASAQGQGTVFVNQTMMTRCPVEAWRVAAGQQANAQSGPLQYGTCMAGSWDSAQWDPTDPCWRRDPASNRVFGRPECDAYPTWIAGRRHHHEWRFVKVKGHGVGIAPRHALDAKGHAPVNAKTPILVLAAEKGQLKAGVATPSNKGVYAVASFPHEMEQHVVASAPRVTQPVIQAKTATSILPKGMVGEKQSAATRNLSAIHFDYRSGNFVGKTGAGAMSHSVVVAHTGGTGGIGAASHGSSGGGGGGSHGGGGSASGGGGGGGHSGGGSAGGGGGGGGGHH